MLIEKSQPSGQRIMSEIRLTLFPALTVYPRAEISLSASETDARFYLSYRTRTRHLKKGRSLQRWKVGRKAHSYLRQHIIISTKYMYWKDPLETLLGVNFTTYLLYKFSFWKSLRGYPLAVHLYDGSSKAEKWQEDQLILLHFWTLLKAWIRNELTHILFVLCWACFHG